MVVVFATDLNDLYRRVITVQPFKEMLELELPTIVQTKAYVTGSC